MSWSEQVEQWLGPLRPGPVERLAVRPGEVTARVGGFEVSLIRTVPEDARWERVCAALASQEVFRARVLAGELPPAAARVCAMFGVDLVPRGWEALVATCSCDRWDAVCAHLRTTAAALGAGADRDPFSLTRWAGLDKGALRTRVMAAGRIKGPSVPEETARDNASEAIIEDAADPAGHAPDSAAVFWSAPSLPGAVDIPSGSGDRVRAAAPGALADEIPPFPRPAT
ncbi:hypothetical protein SUDANB121_00668 [Nocardiopsis dassonvillei]|uniref:hypothetical protein n=1 Tax=Nocardiopsis dassonvillei TaxID=2014 RepID=UPI003F551403